MLVVAFVTQLLEEGVGQCLGALVAALTRYSSVVTRDTERTATFVTRVLGLGSLVGSSYLGSAPAWVVTTIRLNGLIDLLRRHLV